ncbi:hypothetical protein KSB_55540 [Ktedonobacter robiniae]|uniref:Uncharacterized protein n=1 Tax=Ktedonobacter robiniae TaxID=2778365 RepID=A0ABQ3UW66_9CHLR|nr:hypothetical protein KSB_55540 [Ktedonobacter robiniae]
MNCQVHCMWETVPLAPIRGQAPALKPRQDLRVSIQKTTLWDKIGLKCDKRIM